MKRRIFTWLVCAAALAAPGVQAAGASGSAPPAAAPGHAARALALDNAPWRGDFDAMLERRLIRVVVPYSRSLYYLDRGRERGVTAELARDFERWVNQRYRQRLGQRPLSVVLIPTPRDALLPKLLDGRSDMAGGNLTVTEARDRIVDFVAPADLPGVNEVIATGPKSPPLATLDDLAGKTVHARPATSYFESLQRLDARFQSEGKPRLRIVLLPDALEDEDKLEMLNAGLLEIVAIDDWKGRIWANVLPRIKLREDLVLRSGGRTGMAIRPESPQLAAALGEFYEKQVRPHRLIAQRQAQLLRRVKQIRNNAGAQDLRRFEQTIGLFRKYGQKYDFDPMMLAAQGYQESQLRQEARSHVGAIGVMQVMPATGKELAVGDIAVIEPNIHAGSKYMDWLMTRYFTDAKFTGSDRTLFAFASYNAGPGNISKMRRLAGERGLDPDQWFNNVELVTADRIGLETTTYVRNIFKYYVSYRLLTDSERTRADAVRAAASSAGGGRP